MSDIVSVINQTAMAMQPDDPNEPNEPNEPNDPHAKMWQAVVQRTPDASFVYGVRSTGIYCRATCPSRRPRREQVVFFATPAEAEQAGFRACRRCRPDEADPADPHLELVQQIAAAIAAQVQQDGKLPTLAALGAQFALSPTHLQKVFKRVMGVSPRQYADAVRMQVFKQQLADNPAETISGALYSAGYGSSSRLYEGVAARLGMSPSMYRGGGTQQGSAVMIDYTVVASPVGQVLLAATAQGVCAVRLGDDAAVLEAELRREYPQAQISRNDDTLAAWAQVLVAHLAGQHPDLNLPLDVQATAFQWQVWQALRAIPYGETRSYQAVAASLGKPQASRAVARACATNQVALLIPCHRVVRGNGELGGYRWGIERKRELLKRERAQA